jgi:Heterokaryon incompatibility protein (HET)
MKGIQWSELPKTFQDAIVVTRELGILHIWIDCLCIVQDDENDWAVESSKMASIYSNSYLTISANAAANAQEGCFTRSENLIQPAEICLDTNGRSVFSMMDIHDDSQPLMQRGWAFQERRLSRRSIFFNKRELVWVCHTETICECKSSVPHSRDPYLTRGITERMEDWWHLLVSMYSGLLLTKSEDKLPALSGIAHMYMERKKEKAHPGKYIAGLWEANAIGHLCWAATTPSRDLPHYRAPTWSWASVDTPIEYPMNQRDYTLWDLSKWTWCANLVSAACQPSTADPYGQVSSGYIEIMVSIFEASLCLQPSNRGEFVVKRQMATNNDDENEGQVIFSKVRLDQERMYRLVKSSLSPVKICCAILMDDSSNWHTHDHIALLLENCGQDDGTFRRIGLAEYGSRDQSFYTGSKSTIQIT